LKQKLTDITMSEKTIQTRDEDQKILEVLASVLRLSSGALAQGRSRVTNSAKSSATSGVQGRCAIGLRQTR